jgi:NAD(P)-dependent dehydrogenase (short-subunit alcohol dehydrogenase family)
MSIFKDKVCVITGAASGMGRELARQLGEQGAVLALSDIDAKGLEETREMIGAGNRILVDEMDVSDKQSVIGYPAKVEAALGPADFVFNNAGMTRVGDVMNTPLESMEQVMDVNFWGVIRMTKVFLPQLVRTKGVVTNISSLFGLIAYRGQAHYCASKFGVRGFTETLALEMEEAGTGVGVCCVHPGGVQTNVARNAKVDFLPDGVVRETLDKDFDELAITTVEDAVKTILDGTAKRKKRILIGKDAKVASFLQRLMPIRYQRILAKYTKDRAQI